MPRITRDNAAAKAAKANAAARAAAAADPNRPKRAIGRTKTAIEFRAVVKAIMERNMGKVERWLNEVAEGSARKELAPDPARALDLFIKLVEFAAPKVQRMEISPWGDNPNAAPPVTQIAITFVDGQAPSAQPATPQLASGEAQVLEALPPKHDRTVQVRTRVISPRSKLIG